MSQLDKLKEQIDQLHNCLLYMNEAIDRMGKGAEVLAKVFKIYEQNHDKQVDEAIKIMSEFDERLNRIESHLVL